MAGGQQGQGQLCRVLARVQTLTAAFERWQCETGTGGVAEAMVDGGETFAFPVQAEAGVLVARQPLAFEVDVLVAQDVFVDEHADFGDEGG